MSDDAARDVRRAWWSLAGYVPALMLAFYVGEAIYAALVDDGAEPAVWQVLLAAVPAWALFALPGVAAYHFGRQAVRSGRDDGRAPMVLGAGVALGFVGINVVSYLVQVAFG